MPFIEWQYGQQVLTGTQSHWFNFDLDEQNGEILVTVPYTTDYGNGAPPWTVTLTTIGIDLTGHVKSQPIPLTTYTTGFDFQTADVGLINNEAAIFWTSAHGTYPASSAVDLKVRAIDADNEPVGTPVTLLSGVENLEQFRVSSAALGSEAYLVTYSTYDASSNTEVIRYKGFEADGSAITGESGLLDHFKSDSYDAFGFGTLHPASTPDAEFLYLREVNVGLSQELGYQTIRTDGVATGSFNLIDLAYTPGSTKQLLRDWIWDRLEPSKGSENDLFTMSLIDDVDASGDRERSIDVHILNTNSGADVNEQISVEPYSTTSLAETRLSDGGFVIGYTNLNIAYLREYDNFGDVIGRISFELRQTPESFKLEALPEDRLAVVYSTDAATFLDYDVYTIPAGTIAYEVHKGVTRRGVTLNSNDGMTVEAGGIAIGTKSRDGANGINVMSGASTFRTVLAGNSEEIHSGGSAYGTIVNGIGSQSVIEGSIAVRTVVNSNGSQFVSGVTKNTILNPGGFQLLSGVKAKDIGATLNIRASQWVSGHVYRTVIKGGNQRVEDGVARDVMILSGSQDVEGGGTATGTTIDRGFQGLGNGGRAVMSIVNKGGVLQISTGSYAREVTDNSGGVVKLFGTGKLVASNSGISLSLNGGKLVRLGGNGESLVTGDIINSGTNTGTIESTDGVLKLNGVTSGPMVLKADAGATLALEKAVGLGSRAMFNGDQAILQLNDAPEFSGTILDFGEGEKIDLGHFATAGETLEYTANSRNTAGILEIVSGVHKADLQLIGQFMAAGFHFASDGSNGTAVTYAPPTTQDTGHVTVARA